jgi:hypothetical protein
VLGVFLLLAVKQQVKHRSLIGVALLALLPAKEPSPAGAPISEPRFAER